MFAGKHGFITLRDLFRWAERYRLEEQADGSRDWLQLLADDGMGHLRTYAHTVCGNTLFYGVCFSVSTFINFFFF